MKKKEVGSQRVRGREGDEKNCKDEATEIKKRKEGQYERKRIKKRWTSRVVLKGSLYGPHTS